MSSKTTFLAVEGHASNWEEAIRLCGDHLRANQCAGLDFTEACIEREKEYPTGLPTDIPCAIPHSRSDSIAKNTICFLRLDEPVCFQRMDDDEESCMTTLVFNLAIKGAEDHMEFLKKLMKFVTDDGILENISSMNLQEIPAFMANQLD